MFAPREYYATVEWYRLGFGFYLYRTANTTPGDDDDVLPAR